MKSSVKTILVTLILAMAMIMVFGLRGIWRTERVPAVITDTGVSFAVTIADTDAERQQGLSNSQPLASNTGMLFVFDESDQYGFWMHEMSYPIDIVWIDENWKIVHIVPDVDPSSYPEVFMPAVSARYVLEIPAGSAREYGIKNGSTVAFQK